MRRLNKIAATTGLAIALLLGTSGLATAQPGGGPLGGGPLNNILGENVGVAESGPVGTGGGTQGGGILGGLLGSL